ncbi:curli production assembly/transport protein CsgE [Serratia sp. M24T3]|uniref:curli production assembly/transport protein CsgE n=1 Tax=Serratia sp. M24T3 TaxID=932213 RepID=UPI000313D2B6|nr:curli production assembly/transport protein CsgE [Serratia sp. M24T3]
MKTLIRVVFLFFIISSFSLQAAESPIGKDIKDPGLITDHTVSSVGHDFYRMFADRWERNYPETITISERPSARWGSWITIKVGQDLLYQTLLFPTRRNFGKEVDTALQGVGEALSRRQIDKKLLGTGDLSGDEF